MRIIIAGGGTGGHVFPAISIAEEILLRNSNNKVLFIGTEKGIERNIIPQLGYDIEFINSGGLIGKNLLQKLIGITSAFNGIISSINILRKFKPDIVLGVGGYASGPTVLSAFLSFIPTAICEQNSIPGFTNRILSKFVKKIFVTFEDSKKFFPPGKTVVTGNPIRSNLKSTKPQINKSNNNYNIFVLGGSQGAKILNKIVPLSLMKLNVNNINIIHQTGSNDYSEVVKAYENSKINAEVYKFIDNISEIYEKTDLIICRSGAGTLSEITAKGIPSILIPFPFAAHDHQLLNARYLEKNGAAIVIEESKLSENMLSEQLKDILNKDKLEILSDNSKKLGRPQAATDIVNQIEILIRKN